MQIHERTLARQTFLSGLTPGHIAQIAACASEAQVRAGEFIFREGEMATRFYIITRGRVGLEIHVPGRGAVAIATIHDGDAVGWSWLFPPYRWHFDARALEAIDAIAFDAPRLRAACEANHDLGYELMKRFAQTIVQRLQATRVQLMDVYGVQPGFGHGGPHTEGARRGE